ncbi:MAG: prephenate dehydrogenase [Eubacteriaceae bacterium]|nr:prephenate dehydrogenase [Eubacteriaceae bacterium]
MEADFRNKKILVAGLGLMGSAFADGLKVMAPEKVYATDLKQEVLLEAEESGLIHKGFMDPAEILPECDIVIICLYLQDALDFIRRNMNYFKKDCLITDIVGVKRALIDGIKDILRKDVDFIPGHPMAGRERTKEHFTPKSIFAGKNYLLTPSEKNRKENVELLKTMINKMGFGRIIITDPETHDEKIAFTSQLCHVIAASMVDLSDDSGITSFEGGSFQDMTRIAMINSEMWAELFIANSDKLTRILDNFIDSINFFKDNIKAGNSSVIVERFNEIGLKREAMGK